MKTFQSSVKQYTTKKTIRKLVAPVGKRICSYDLFAVSDFPSDFCYVFTIYLGF